MSFNRIIFAAGVLIGAAGGGFATYMLTKKKQQEKFNAQLAELTNSFIENKKKESGAEEVKEEKKEAPKDVPVPNKPVTAKPEQKTGEFRDYGAFYPNTKVAPVRDDREVIVPIDEDQYGENECELITRYNDGIFADEEFREITHPEGVLGQSAVDHFEGGDTDTIWVRNLTRQRDYEIQFEERTFDEARPRWFPSD